MNSCHTIHATRRTDPQAQLAVLQALKTEVQAGAVRPIITARGLEAGSATVTTAEVLSALQGINPTSSPGLDRLPYTLWRVGEDCWAPLLARLFSAIGTHGCMPTHFNRGSVTPLPKEGVQDIAAPAAFRPITLLPTLYRILAKVLAARFGIAMAPAVGAEQSAYLPGRLIGDNINFTSLLPVVMAQHGITGATVFVDISKAYDSVDREFLFQAMEAMDASPGMINWARILLHNTVASTHVNGVESSPRTWHAGVRQGCPLSPLLYLFVAQALTSWLRAQPLLGITIQGVRYVTTQFADDTQIHLSDFSPAALAGLSASLVTFGKASGQVINTGKSAALLMGAPHPLPMPHMLAGIPVVQHTISLGVPQSNPAAPLLQQHEHQHDTRSSLLPPRLLAEPDTPENVRAAWDRRVSRAKQRLITISRMHLSAMGRGQAASAYALHRVLFHAEFAGIPSDDGDLGHTAATIVSDTVPHDLLSGSPSCGGFGLLPLHAHVQARHASMASRLLFHLLSQPRQLTDADHPPALPPWVTLAAAALRHCCPTLHPAQTLLCSTLSTPANAAQGVLGLPALHQPHRIPSGLLTRMAVALQAVGPLAQSTAEAGVSVRVTLTTPTPSSAAAPATLLKLGWNHPLSMPSNPLPPITPAAELVTVRAYGALLTPRVAIARSAKHRAYVQLAMSSSTRAAVAAAVPVFQAAMAKAWRLRCDNGLKETLWLLAVDSIPGARVARWRCPCVDHFPNASTSRQHSFWECHAAVAVRNQLTHALGGAAVSQASVWLLTAPRQDIADPVWTLVCLAALRAMDWGRRKLWAQYQPLPAVVANETAAEFWQLLQEFVVTYPRPLRTWPVLPPDHPFICMRMGRLVLLNTPPPAPPPPAPPSPPPSPPHPAPLSLLQGPPLPLAITPDNCNLPRARIAHD